MIGIQDIIQLDKEWLLRLNGSDSLFWDGFFASFTSPFTWIPLYLALLYVIIKNNKLSRILLILLSFGLLILFADQLASGICKPYFARLRPTHDFQLGAAVATVNGIRGGLYGFFSSHAANSFAIAVLASWLIKDKWLTGVLLVWAALMGYSRIYLGVHFPGDVLVGTFVGLVLGTMIFFGYSWVCNRYFESNQYISTQYTLSGFIRDDLKWVYLTLLGLLYYCIIRGMFIVVML